MDDLEPPARVVRLDAAAARLQGAELARAIGVPAGRPVVALAATTAELSEPLAGRLAVTLRAVAAVLAAQRAVVITGGTDAGVIRLLGRALAEQLPGAVLVGVSPEQAIDSGGTPLEPNHDVSVLVPGERWGDETDVLSRVAAAVADGQPVVGLLIGGGDVARAELHEHLRQHRPVLVVGGSGRLADEVAAAASAAPELHAVRLDDGPARVAEALAELLTPQPARTLRDALPALLAWPRLHVPEPPRQPLLGAPAGALYPELAAAIGEAEELVAPAYRQADLNAVREQNRHRLFVVLALIGGLATTLFASMQLLTTAAWPGIAVAALGTATSALAAVARAGGALDAHLNARLRAERLRALYFEHIAAAPPPDEREHAERLTTLTLSVVQQRPGAR